MPHLSADSLANDLEGLAFLRGVLHADGQPAAGTKPPLLEQVAARKAWQNSAPVQPDASSPHALAAREAVDDIGFPALEALA